MEYLNNKDEYIECRHGKALYYHVPTNTVLKITLDLYKAINNPKKNTQDAEILHLQEYLSSKCETIPSHSFWKETGILNKLTLIISTTCNLKCSYCYAQKGKYSGYPIAIMKPDNACTYIDSLIEEGIHEIKTIMFFGGEPLIGSNTIESVCRHINRLVSEHKLTTLPAYTMVTNMTLCFGKAAEMIRKNNIRVTASIDGSKLIHDQQRMFCNDEGTFDLIYKNFESIKDNIAGIEATYTMNHVNQGISVIQVKQWLTEQFHVNIQHISVIPVEGCPSIHVDSHLYKNMLKDTIITDEDTVILGAFNPKMQSDLLCNAGFNSLCLMPDGDIYPCHMYALNKAFCLGNINNSAGFSERIQNMLAASEKSLHVECMDCWARKFCHICPAKACIPNGGKQISEEKCNKRRNKYEEILWYSVYGR